MKKIVTILVIALIIVAMIAGIAYANSNVTVSVHVSSKVVASLDGEVEANLPYKAEYIGGILTVVPIP